MDNDDNAADIAVGYDNTMMKHSWIKLLQQDAYL